MIIILKQYPILLFIACMTLGLRLANETSLQSNAVSHWLGTNLESALAYGSRFTYEEQTTKN